MTLGDTLLVLGVSVAAGLLGGVVIPAVRWLLRRHRQRLVDEEIRCMDAMIGKQPAGMKDDHRAGDRAIPKP